VVYGVHGDGGVVPCAVEYLGGERVVERYVIVFSSLSFVYVYAVDAVIYLSPPSYVVT
jgi:hypothetical protein